MSNEELVEQIQKGVNVSENMGTLYTNNKNFIISIAMKYSGLAEMEDLLQEGYIGLHTATGKYVQEHGTAFLTYAGYWIKQQIIRYLENNGLVRMPSYLHKRMQQYSNLQNSFMSRHGKRPMRDEICRCLNLSWKQVEKLERDIHAYKIMSLDTPVSDDDELCLSDCLPSEGTSGQFSEHMEFEELKNTLWAAVGTLDENQSKILHCRYQDGMTLVQAGKQIGETASRAMSCETKALNRLRTKKEIKQLGYDYGYIHSTAYRYGISRFFTDWTSSTEYVALKNLVEQGY